MCLQDMSLHKAVLPVAKHPKATPTFSYKTSFMFLHVGMPCDTVAPQTDSALLTSDWKIQLVALQLVVIWKPQATHGALFAVEVRLG
jgi:hypothetical protein